MNDHNYVYPPSIPKAQQHAKASLIFKRVEPNNIRRCQCCERLIGDSQPKQTCYDPKELAFLGQGIPLYFQTMRSCIIILLVTFVSFGAYGLYSNQKGGDCVAGRTVCQENLFNQLSILNKSTSTDMLQTQNYMVMVTILLMIVVMQYVRRQARILEAECDRMIDSPSDYSMILKQLPEGYTEADILEMIDNRRKFLSPQQLQETQGLNVEKIIMAFSLKEINENKEKNLENFKKCQQQGKTFEKIQEPEAKKHAPTAVVVFSSQYSKNYFITQPKFFQKVASFFWSIFIPKSQYTVKSQFICIQRAPQPDDINWQNCGISLGGTICRRLMGQFSMIIFMVVGALVQIGMQYLDERVFTNPDTKQFSSTIFSLVVSIFNGVIGILLIHATRKQRLETVTEYNHRLAVKITLYQFINAGILVIISNSILLLDFDKFAQKFSLGKGLASDATQIMIINIIAPNLALFVVAYMNPGKWITKKRINKSLQEPEIKKRTIFVQQQVNQAYEGTQIDLASRYSFVLRTMLLCALFSPFIPIAIPLSIISLFLTYHLEKFLFNKAYKVPNMTSSMLDNQVTQLLQYFPLVIALGNYFLYLYFVYFQFDQVPLYYGVPIYISIAVSGINIFLPMDNLNRCLFPLKEYKIVKPLFKQAEMKFITDYDIANPVYRHKNKKHKNYMLMTNMANLGKIIEMTDLSSNPFAALFRKGTMTDEGGKKVDGMPLLNKEKLSEKNEKEWNDQSKEYISAKVSEMKPNVNLKQLIGGVNTPKAENVRKMEETPNHQNGMGNGMNNGMNNAMNNMANMGNMGNNLPMNMPTNNMQMNSMNNINPRLLMPGMNNMHNQPQYNPPPHGFQQPPPFNPRQSGFPPGPQFNPAFNPQPPPFNQGPFPF